MNCRSMLKVTPAVCTAVIAMTLFGLASASRGAPETVIPLQPTLASSAGDSGQDAASGQPDRHDSGWNHFVRWIGHFHPPLTAFPIAMLLGAALAEALRLLFKADWLDGATRWCIILGGFSAIITAPLGWAFAVDHSGSWILEVHRWLGTAAAVGALVLLVLSEWARRRRGGALKLFRVVLFLAVPLVVATGFFGGAMVYGIHAYNWNSADAAQGGQ